MTIPGVVGVGIDLVENDRIRGMVDRWAEKFTERVFLPREREYCESMAAPFRHYAGRFAVKEAVSKAFQTGISPHLSWLDMEVVRHPGSGAPSIQFSGRATEYAASRGVDDVMISLSHTRAYAIAQAILIGSKELP